MEELVQGLMTEWSFIKSRQELRARIKFYLNEAKKIGERQGKI